MSQGRVRILVYGTGENSGQAASIFRHDPSIEIVGYVDDGADRHGTTHLGRPVLGGGDALPEIVRTHGVQGGFAAIGDNRARARAGAALRAAGLRLVSAIHPQTYIDAPRSLGEGIMVEMGAAIHAGAAVGDGSFVMGGAIVSHHSTVGDWTLLAGGVVFGGNVTIGDYTLLGCGTVVQPHTRIGAHVTTGIGTAVTKDLPDRAIAVGVPAKIIKYADAA
jgi:sugar O-acyltransferase (sialic acid O-acetyltransferase NeuD family)